MELEGVTATPSLNDGRPGHMFVSETRFSRDNHLEMYGWSSG
jgi:hypothetical protein